MVHSSMKVSVMARPCSRTVVEKRGRCRHSTIHAGVTDDAEDRQRHRDHRLTHEPTNRTKEYKVNDGRRA